MKKIINRKAYFDFRILETLEAGILLTGPEVKSIKSGRLKLDGAHVRIINDEAYLVNADIPLYESAHVESYDADRTRKLLLRKKQLISLDTKLRQKKLTIVPISCYTTRNLIKIEIGLGQRKKSTDKREEIKKRDLAREVERTFTNRG